MKIFRQVGTAYTQIDVVKTRLNSGATVAAIDGDINWKREGEQLYARFLNEMGWPSSLNTYHSSVDQATVPPDIWNQQAMPNSSMTLQAELPSTEGQEYEIRFFLNGDREFHIQVDGQRLASNVNPQALFGVGVGGMLSVTHFATGPLMHVEFVDVINRASCFAIEVIHKSTVENATEEQEIHDIEIDRRTELKQAIGGEDLITSYFILEGPDKLDIRIGDYIKFKGTEYTILEEPQVKKVQHRWEYRVDFKSDMYRMMNVLLINPETDETSFFLFGNAQDQISLVINNLNRVYAPQGSGLAMYYTDYVEQETEYINMSFKDTTCLGALQQIADRFKLEYLIEGKKITLKKKIGVERELTFNYGSELREIERMSSSHRELVTRLYVFGSSRNINPTNYDSPRLKIAPIEDNVEIFGIKERTITFDEIYPRHKGAVSTYNGDHANPAITDSSIVFNLNNHLLPGLTAKIAFNSGDLAGREFEINGYSSTTKKVTFTPFEDDLGNVFPNSVLYPRVGDKYVFLDVEMPNDYIISAEAELLQKGMEYIAKYSLPLVTYRIHPHYPALRAANLDLRLGDVVTVQDDDFNINFQTRILSLTQKVYRPSEYELKIGKEIQVSYMTQVLKDTREIRNEIYFRDKYIQDIVNRAFLGVNFKQAPFINMGEFNENTYYHNNQNRIDFVYVRDNEGVKHWYYFTGADHTRGAWNEAEWQLIGSAFDIIATQTILAENANIGNWIIQNGQIVSQKEGWPGEANAQLDGLNGLLRFISAIDHWSSNGYRRYKQIMEIGGREDGLTVVREGDQYQLRAYTEVSSAGVYSDFAGQSTFEPNGYPSVNGAIAGLGRAQGIYANFIAGVVGRAEKPLNSMARYMGGLFWKLKSFGRYVNVTQVQKTATEIFLDEHSEFISCYNTGDCRVWLPPNPDTGQKIVVKRINGPVEIFATNNKQIVSKAVVSHVWCKDGDAWELIFDGTYWVGNVRLYY